MRSCTDASLRSRERTSGKNLGYLEHTRSTGGSQRRVHTVHGPRKRGGSRYRVGPHVNRTYLVHGFCKRGVVRVRCGAHIKYVHRTYIARFPARSAEYTSHSCTATGQGLNRVAATRLRRHTPAPAPPLSLLPPQSLVYEPPHATSRTARQGCCTPWFGCTICGPSYQSYHS